MADKALVEDPVAKLASELRRFRAVSGLKQGELADALNVSQNLISLYELGKRVPPKNRLDLIDHALGANGQLSRLWSLVSNSDGPVGFGSWMLVEREVVDLRIWEPLLIPGPFQVEGYARRILGGEPGITEEALQKRISQRLSRRELLTRKNRPMIWVVLDEGVLHRPLGGRNVMREQLRFLHEVSDLPHVTIQVLPYEAESTTGLRGSFQVAKTATGAATVYLESAGQAQILDHPETVLATDSRFDAIRADAYPQRLSQKLIKEAEGKWQ